LIESNLVPKHEVLDPPGTEKILVKYNTTLEDLPKILSSDPAIVELKPNVNDVIKITRENPLIGKSYYYRVVVEG